MTGAQVGEPGGRLKPPTEVKPVVFQGDAVKITWTDASNNEVGFRVDRKIASGRWTSIAYRPPRIKGRAENPQMWIDYLAPTNKPLVYRVAALNEKDNDDGASETTDEILLAAPNPKSSLLRQQAQDFVAWPSSQEVI